MDPTAIQAGSPPPPSAADSAVQATPSRPELPPLPARPPKSLPLRLLQPLASLRLTVALFALSVVLVFYSTWAQVDTGLHNVVNQYFRSFVAWIPLRVVLF